MPRISIPLNDTHVKALKPKAKRYMLTDGGEVCLRVMTSGAKIWRYRYRLNGKQQPLATIGDYPAIGVQDARERGRKYAEIVATGVSPIAGAKKDRGAAQALNTVKEFGNFWFDAEIADKSPSYSKTNRRALDKDIYPAIGNKALLDVNAGDVLAICDRVKNRGAPQAALFTRNVVKRLFEYAIARHVATSNPAQQLVARFIRCAPRSPGLQAGE